MLSPVWIEFRGLDGDPVYLCGASAVEATPEGARIRSDGAWVYVLDEPSVVLERFVKASEFSVEATLVMVKTILDELTAGEEPVN